MFQGKQYEPNTKFQFVNYEQSDSQNFKDQKKSKSQIPFTMKFQLDGHKPQPKSQQQQLSQEDQHSPIPNSTTTTGKTSTFKSVPPEQQHTFVARTISISQRNARKASYTISTKSQKMTLLDLMIQKRLYSAKSKLDTWAEIVKIYNEIHGLDAKEGLTVQHARVKYNQILASAKEKQSTSQDLTDDEAFALRYDEAKQDFKYDHNKNVRIDKKYENKNPKSTKVYETIITLQEKLNNLKNGLSGTPGIANKYKNELWLLQKRTTDLKTIEEQYQILEQVDYSTDGTRVKVSKEMRTEINSKVELVQNEIEKVSRKIENDLKVQHAGDDDDDDEVMVDTELLDKK